MTGTTPFDDTVGELTFLVLSSTIGLILEGVNGGGGRMSLHMRPASTVPEDTARVARAAFPRQSVCDAAGRNGARCEESEREKMALPIGQDGPQLLGWVYKPDSPAQLKHCPAVEILRQV